MATKKAAKTAATTKKATPVPAKKARRAAPAPAPKRQSFAPKELDFDEDDEIEEETDENEDGEGLYEEDEDEEEAEEDEDALLEDEYEEYDEEEEEEPPPPRRRSRAARKAPKRRRVNFSAFDQDPDDPTDRVPDFHGGQDLFTKGNSKLVEVAAERTGYDNFQLREVGEVFEIRVLYAKDEKGQQTKKLQRGGIGGIPEWCCLKHEYRAPEVDLPGTKLDKRLRNRQRRVQSVRGGATGMRDL